jgi:hypothetical protein
VKHLPAAGLALLLLIGLGYASVFLLLWMPGFFALVQSVLIGEKWELDTARIVLRFGLFLLYSFSLWRVARAAWRSGRGTAAPGEGWKAAGLAAGVWLACGLMSIRR